ncbi:MAG: 4-hydroxythreonine-4-phosphate dehydrogenase [Gemmatimonadales bacterium]
MLTHSDVTVADPVAVYEHIRPTEVRWVGFKDLGASFDTLRRLTDRIRADGRAVAMEIVSQAPDDELRAVDVGLELGVDLLMGGTHPGSVVPRIIGAGLKFLPFCGRVSGHPSVLSGTPDEIGAHARRLAETPGVDGLDLLAYRHAGDARAVMASVVRESDRPVVVAGSIDRNDRIATVVASGAWGFTVGSAIFERAFVPSASLVAQVEHVLRVAGTGTGPTGGAPGALGER